MDLFPTASVSEIFEAFIAKVAAVLTPNIITLLLIVGALIGLGFVVRLVKRHIGRRL